jgi:hypothetical protein
MAMGTGPAARVLRVILPSALPEVLLGCRVGLAMALIVMITSEMIARQSGVGNILFNSLDMALYDNVYAMIVVLAALGFALDLGFERLRRRLTFWAETGRVSCRTSCSSESPPADGSRLFSVLAGAWSHLPHRAGQPPIARRRASSRPPGSDCST